MTGLRPPGNNNQNLFEENDQEETSRYSQNNWAAPL